MPTPVFKKPILPSETAKQVFDAKRESARNAAQAIMEKMAIKAANKPPRKEAPSFKRHAPVPAKKALVAKVDDKFIAASEILTDKIKEMEEAWLRKNSYDRNYKALVEEVKELLDAEKVTELNLEIFVKDIDRSEVPVNFNTYMEKNGQRESIDRKLLKRLVNPAIYERCLNPQKGLIVEHAGQAVLDKCITYTSIAGEFRVIKQEKVKVKTAKVH